MSGSPIGGNVSVDQPTISPQAPSRLANIDVRANPSDFGAAQGLSQFGQDLGEVGSNVQQMSDKRDALFAQQIASQAEVTWKQNLSNAQQQFTLDPSKGSNYADTFKSQYNDYQQKILDDNPNITQNAKNLVMTHTNALGASLFSDALSLQAKAATDWSVQSFATTSDNIKQAANGQDASVQLNDDGSLKSSSFDDARAKLTNLYQTANGQVPTKLVKDRLLQDHLEIDKAEIDTSTEQNGALKTAALIKNGTLGTSLTIPQRFMQMQELQRQGKMDAETNLQSTTKDLTTFIDGVKMGVIDANDPRGKQLISNYANASGDLKDIHLGIAQEALTNAAKEGIDQKAVDSFPTGLTKEGTENDVNAVTAKASQIGGNVIPYDVNAITANYGIARVNPNESAKAQIYTAQEASQKAQQAINSAQLTGVARQKMLSMNPQDAATYFNGLTQTLGADHPALKDIAAFENQREKLLVDDPARVALSDDSINAANTKAETLSHSLLTPSMGATPPNIKDVQAANNDAISKIYAFQDQVGVPHNPLTQDQANYLAQTFLQTSTKNPEGAIALKNQLKQMYPSDKLSDVISAVPLDTKLSLFMGLPSGSQQERNFAESLAVSDKDKNMGQKDKVTLDKAFDPSNSPIISQFLQSQISNGATGVNAKQAVTSVQSALRDYATVLASKNKSNDLSSAISTAPSDILGSIYGFTSINGQTVAIPRAGSTQGVSFRSDGDISKISQGLQIETNKIFSNPKPDIDLTGALARYQYQDTDTNQKMALNDLKQNAYWTTGVKGLTGDNQAVLFGFDHYGNRFPILDSKGTPITRDLDAMETSYNNAVKQRNADTTKGISESIEEAASGEKRNAMTEAQKNSPFGGGVDLSQGKLGQWLHKEGLDK